MGSGEGGLGRNSRAQQGPATLGFPSQHCLGHHTLEGSVLDTSLYSLLFLKLSLCNQISEVTSSQLN
jgi:hypothetical protein